MLDATAIQALPMKQTGKDVEAVKARVNELWSKATSAEKKAAQELAGANRVTFHRAYTNGSLNLRVAVALAQVFKVNPAYLTGAANAHGTCSDKNLNAFLAAYGAAVDQPASAADEGMSAAADVAGVAYVAAQSDAHAESPIEIPTKILAEAPAKRRGAGKQAAKTPTAKQGRKPRGTGKQAAAANPNVKAETASAAAVVTETVAEVLPESAAKPVTDISSETQRFMDVMSDEDMAVLLKAALLRAKANVPEAVKTLVEIKRLLLSVG